MDYPIQVRDYPIWMDWHILLPLGLVILVIALCVFNARRRTRIDKQRITEFLTTKGATNITISTKLFDGDEDTDTYFVEYTDNHGKEHRNRCKINNGLYSQDDSLYWRDPL